MENSARPIKTKFTPKMSVVKGKLTTKKNVNDKIAINTLAPNFNFTNNRGETMPYKALEI